MSATINILKRKFLLILVFAASFACLTSIKYLTSTLNDITVASRTEIKVNGRSGIEGKVDDDDDTEEELGDDGELDEGEEMGEDGVDDKIGTETADVACYKSPMLPKRMYSVIGHESSGTQFTTGIIRDALDLPIYREGSRSYEKTLKPDSPSELQYTMEKEPIQAQHFSLPWGSVCTDRSLGGKQPPIVDVVLPPQCSRVLQPGDSDEVKDCCDAMAKDLLGSHSRTMPVKYPKRYNLDIVSHKEWWDAHGVDQWIIIVLRDKDISATARYKGGHCTIKGLLEKEEETARAIIIDAINKYILDKDEKKVTSETYNYWHAERFQKAREGIDRRRLRSEDIDDYASMVIPSRNKVVLVSYESMMHLQEVYVEMLYRTLGIETDYMPNFKNGNSKYVPSSPYFRNEKTRHQSKFDPKRTRHLSPPAN